MTETSCMCHGLIIELIIVVSKEMRSDADRGPHRLGGLMKSSRRAVIARGDGQRDSLQLRQPAWSAAEAKNKSHDWSIHSLIFLPHRFLGNNPIKYSRRNVTLWLARPKSHHPSWVESTPPKAPGSRVRRGVARGPPHLLTEGRPADTGQRNDRLPLSQVFGSHSLA